MADIFPSHGPSSGDQLDEASEGPDGVYRCGIYDQHGHSARLNADRIPIWMAAAMTDWYDGKPFKGQSEFIRDSIIRNLKRLRVAYPDGPQMSDLVYAQMVVDRVNLEFSGRDLLNESYKAMWHNATTAEDERQAFTQAKVVVDLFKSRGWNTWQLRLATPEHYLDLLGLDDNKGR